MVVLLLFSCCVVLQTGKLEGQPGRTLMEAFEQKVNGVLNKARDDAGEAMGLMHGTGTDSSVGVYLSLLARQLAGSSRAQLADDTLVLLCVIVHAKWLPWVIGC